jgi:hypothetical protein
MFSGFKKQNIPHHFGEHFVHIAAENVLADSRFAHGVVILFESGCCVCHIKAIHQT